MMTAVMSAFNGVLLSVIAHLGRDGGLEHCGKSNGDSREPKSAPTTVFRRIFGYGNAAAGSGGRARDLHGRAGVAGALTVAGVMRPIFMPTMGLVVGSAPTASTGLPGVPRAMGAPRVGPQTWGDRRIPCALQGLTRGDRSGG